MYEEALVPRARKIFSLLARFKNFYLAGETALALQIGHRVSVDFDMFTDARLSLRIVQNVKRILKGHQIALTYRAPEQINITVDGIKMTFLSYPYPAIDLFVRYKRVPLASMLEIAAMKANAIGRRLAYKDYVDWYFLLKYKYVNLSDVVAFSEKKFGSDFNSRLFLGQLASLSDVHTQEIDFLQKRISRSVIEKFLEKEVKAYVRGLA